MNDKVMNMSGKAEILIKAAGDYKINNKLYEKDELITILKDASFEIEYSSLNKSGAGKSLVFAFSDFEPRAINIMNKNINENLADILFNTKQKNKQFLVPETEAYYSDETGSIFLNYIPEQSTTVFIFSSEGEKISGWMLDYSSGIISGLVADTQYLISYYRPQIMSSFYELGKNQLPYFSIEIKNENNLDNYGRKMFIQIPKCSLAITPNIGFNSGEITAIPLTFDIIEGKILLGFYK